MPEIDSISNIFKTVFVVLNSKSKEYASVLLMTAAPELQERIDGYKLVAPGVHRGLWSITSAKRISKGLRDLGYTVLVYKYLFVSEWFTPIMELVAVTEDEDTFGPGAPALDFDLSEISACLPTKRTYVELFGGGAPLFLSRPPAEIEVVNDNGRDVINFFTKLREVSSFNWFFLLTRIFPVDSFMHPVYLRKVLRAATCEDEVISAYLWYRYIRQVYRSNNNFGTDILLDEGSTISSLAAIDPLLPSIHGRLIRVQHECNSVKSILSIYDSEDTMFWIDPTIYGRFGVQVGSISEDKSFDNLLSLLSVVKGVVAVYCNHHDVFPGFQQRGDYFSTTNGWIARDFGSSTVWLKNANFKED